MLPFVIDFLVFSLLVLVVITQLLIPIWKGTKIFPIFRKKISSAVNEIQEAQTDLEVTRLKNEAEQIRERVKQTKTTTKKEG